MMNERIKSLKQQAIDEVNLQHFTCPDNIQELIEQKFAELIIEECAFQCQHLGDMERIGKHFEVDVFKQFGV